MFKVGDKAVYPGQGVGEVMGIEHKEVAGQRQSFYVLRILDNGMKIMIPMNKVNSVGLREIIGEKDVRRVYSILREKEVSVDSSTWNRRYREYMDKIKTGSVFEIAEVLRDLYLLRSDKDLSFGERKMLDTARSLLIKELAIAKDCDEQDVEADLKKIFNVTALSTAATTCGGATARSSRSGPTGSTPAGSSTQARLAAACR
jgi:CarD family transcriptional regulator